ncbi:monocarboxylate transporter 13-like [Amphiura filiformis]|uniref:monocarboxylate transporter 13-like n=1 Tax=Amphiura filiformis TaxID=82378 RepID=UPI003B213603
MPTIRKDGSWAWLVSFGIFVALFIETGLVKSLGVLLPDLREQFSTQTWIIGLAISSVPGFGAVTCILSSGLGKLFSHRVIVILFGSLASMGVIIGSMATSVPMLAIGLVVTGCYYGAEAIAFAALPDYFDKYFDVVNGIAHAGMGSGVIVMPLVTQFLLDVYGWRGTVLILGGLTAHIVVSGALLRPVTQGPQVQFSVDDQEHRDTQTGDPLERLHPKDADNLAPNDEHMRKHPKGKTDYFIIRFITAFDLHLFLNIEFVSLTCISTATGYYYTGWLIYLVPHAEDLGFSPYASSAIATFGGIGSLIGSCIFPLLTNVLSTKVLIIMANILVFFSLAVDPIFSALHTYFGLTLASFGVNVGNALWGCCVCKEMSTVVTKDVYTTALNWTYVGYALGSLCSGFLSGWLYDKYGNYTASFLFLSLISLVALTPMILNMLRSTKNREKGHQYTPVPLHAK